jgi:DNA primase
VSGHIPQDVIERVLAAHDIVELVGRHVPLKKTGRAWKACCPFHEEKTPSFTVNPERGTFKCFGCQKGGNIFGWLMEREGLAFPEAVRQLAAEKGIVVPDSRTFRGGGSAPDVSRIESIRAALALAQDLFVRTLSSDAGAEARAYLTKRGFPPPAVKAFGLGLSPDGWDGLLRAAREKGIAATVLEEAGLAVPRDRGDGWYDRFRARLMFPIADAQGRIVTYGARALRPDDNPKYLNGPETAVFKKSKTLYGLDRAKAGIRKVGYAILMEGYTDVLMAHMHGFDAAVAGMGTAFTTEQGKMLANLTEKVVLLYDGDAAGLAAAEKSLDLLLDHGLEVRIALLPDGKDVDEVLLEEGIERLEAIIAGARDLFDFKIARLEATHDLDSPRGRAQAAERLADSARRVKNVLERDLLFRRIVERLNVPEALVRRVAAEAQGAANRQTAAGARSAAAFDAARIDADGGPGAAPEETTKDRDRRVRETILVAAAVFRPEYRANIRRDMAASEILDAGLRTVYEGLCVLADEGKASLEALHGRLASDAAAAKALAGLPDDADFDEYVPTVLRQRAESRARDARRRAVLEQLAPPAPVRPVAAARGDAPRPTPDEPPDSEPPPA